MSGHRQRARLGARAAEAEAEVEVEGQKDVEVEVTEPGLDVDGRLVAWLDVDDVVEGAHRVSLTLASGELLELTHLGATHDRFMADLREARRRIRLPALAMATGEPLGSYRSRAAVGDVHVLVFADVVVLEPLTGRPVAVPLSLVERVERSGHTITMRCRGIDDVSIGMLGPRSDEFEQQLRRCITERNRAVDAALVALDPDLGGLGLVDGWAVTVDGHPTAWAALHAYGSRGPRAEELALLEELAGTGLRLGVHLGDGEPMVVALAQVNGQVAVESLTADDRATFVFALDADAVNVTLLLTRFRREALSSPESALGRWAVAVRTSPVVQAARAALTARIVHRPAWADELRAVLG